MKKAFFILWMLTLVVNVLASEPAGEKAVNKHWSADPHLYANNMTMVGVIQLNGAEIQNESYEIGAFCGEECRGSEVLCYYATPDRYLVFMTVYGDENDAISFRLYEHENAYEFVEATASTVTFTVNAMHGMPSNPYVFDFTCPLHTVTCTPNAAVAGTVSGGGSFFYGKPCTVSATANPGFLFSGWAENGAMVSSQANYSFNVTASRDLVAVFQWPVTDTVADGCDAFTWHGHTYTASGVYRDTMVSSIGIDSIVDLHLTLHPPYHIDLYETACGVYYWDDEPLEASGDYVRQYESIYGCDSVETLHLTVIPIRPLGTFGYMSPANNYVDKYTGMDFYWSAVANATGYDFYFWEGDGGRPETPVLSNAYSFTYRVSNLEHGGVYHWCVVARNECVEEESEVRTFTCQLDPSMTVVPRGTMDFGEVELGQSNTKVVSVSGVALTEPISYAFLDNAWGQDAEYFHITPSNWDPASGGKLNITFEPAPTQLYYHSAVRIASGAFADTLYFMGSVANRYVFTTEVEGEVYSASDSIQIHGHVEDILGNVAPDLAVTVYLTVMGTRITMPVMSDANGDYCVTYVPRYSESGYYQVGSCLHGDYTTVAHDAFDIPGMGRDGDFIIWTPYQDETLTGTIEIRNRSRIPISGIQVNTVSLPSGCTVDIGGVTELGPLETGLLQYTVTGSEVSMGNGYDEAVFNVTSDEGVSMNLTCYYYCRPRRGALDVYPPSVYATSRRGAQKVLSFQIANNGNGETGPITIGLPNTGWMSVMGDNILESLQAGDSCAFSILLSPGANVGLTQYSGSFAVNCSNGSGFSIPYRIEVTADTTTRVVVDVTDDYTYNTNNGNGPHLAGANVSLTSYYSLDKVAEGMTDENGLFVVEDVPEGYYYLSIYAESHKSYDGIIYVDAGQPTRESRQEVYLQFQAITYSWVVVPTEIEDQYDFELVADIQTNVPVPVVVIDAPSLMDTLAYGDTLHYSITVTNYGLVDALDVQLTMPTGIYEYDFYSLFDHIDTLHAKTSVVVPCMLTRTRRERITEVNYNLGFVSNFINDHCTGEYIEFHFWMCNAERKWDEYVRMVRIIGSLDCDFFPEISAPDDGSGGSGGGGGGFPLWYLHNPFSGHGNLPVPSWLTNLNELVESFINSVDPPVVISPDDCEPCWKALPAALGNLLPGGVLIGDVLYIDELDQTMTDFGETVASDPSSLLTTNRDQLVNYGQLVGEHVLSLTPAGYLGGVALGVDDFLDHLEACITYTNPYRETPSLNSAVEQLGLFAGYYRSLYNEITNLFQEEEWIDEDNIADFLDQFIILVDTVTNLVPPQAAQQLMEVCELTAVNDSIVQRFVDRWNRSIQYWNMGIYTVAGLPEGFDDNFIQLDHAIVQPMVEAVEAAEAYGFDHIGQLYGSAYEILQEAMVEHESDVCAKISVSFKQRMTMTREAFEGTLKIANGHATDAMQDIDVDIVIKDMDGVDRSDLFQINVKSLSQITGVDGTGSLDAQTEGTVMFEMIPTIEAAPDTSVYYAFGGSFSFLDPFSGDVMTYPLFPVKLQVNPSPELHVDYFLSRNIISDDPLTGDTIESTVPAELAMMIRNVGAGDAKNVYLQSSQPQVIDNQNGLLIQFDMVGSSMNGVERPLGLTDIPFGTIESHSAGIAEWYFTSSLLARVTGTTPHVIHNNSYGNPKLSLVTELHSHDLIHAVRGYGDLEDGINDFLVNETTDLTHTPDMIYFSHGGTSPVSKVVQASTNGSPFVLDGEVTLTMTPTSAGWNYVCVDDPAQGQLELIACFRDDGQEIPLSNVWTTWATMLDEGAPTHENKLHLVDTLPSKQPVTYQLVYGNDLFSKITVTVNPVNCGQVTGAGYYMRGDTVTLHAVPSFGYEFDSWSEGNNVVSNDTVFSFVAGANRYLRANFYLSTNTMQQIHLYEGWNWFSSYITYDANTLPFVQEEIRNQSPNAIIKSQHSFAALENNDWEGTLNELENQDMYMIQVGNDLDFTLSGTIVRPSIFPITLYTGWTWVCYIANRMMSLEESLASLNPSEEDIIKSQYGFSVYNAASGEWLGNLTTLKPGEGYAYMNNGTANQTLIYPNSGMRVVEGTPEERHFSPDWHRFMSNMTLMVTLDASEFDLGKGSHEIAAFVGDDCRGSARLQEVNGQYIAFVTVGGEDGEEVTFRLFDVKGCEVYPEVAQERLRYATDAVYGSLREPFKLHFRGTGLDETEAMLRVSPNPVYAHGEVRLSMPTTEKVRVEIYSTLGVKVMSKETSDGRVVLSPAVVPGTYIMKVVSASGAGHYCKLIVK